MQALSCYFQYFSQLKVGKSFVELVVGVVWWIGAVVLCSYSNALDFLESRGRIKIQTQIQAEMFWWHERFFLPFQHL